MKFALSLLALVAVAQAKNILVDPEDYTAYDYLAKYGKPLADEIRATEEADRKNRIVGGSIAETAQFPYQAGLLARFSQGQGVCGASLVSANKLTTAAHCWYDGRNQASSLTVVLGSNTLFFGGTRVDTNDVRMHAGWNPTLIRNDIAIIGLPRNVAFSNSIRPVALPSGNQMTMTFAGYTGTASGFGRTADSSAGSISTNQRLSHVNLEIITNAVCARSFSIVTAGNICTSGANRRSTCSGDSGGPLIVNINNEPVLTGITSFGSARGCQQNFPAAFVRVTAFMDFIRTHL